MSLLKRLERAEKIIKSFYEAEDYVSIAKCCKNFQDLYTECTVLGAGTKEYHYAQYLKYLLLSFFANSLDFNGDSYDIYERSQTEMWKAGLRANKHTGRYIQEEYPDIYA